MSDFEYHVHTDLNLIEVRPGELVQLSDILSYAQEVLSLGIVTEGTVEFYDLSKTVNINLDYKTAHALTHTLREWLSAGWRGSVFFAPQEYQFGMIRMIGAVVECFPDSPGIMMIPRSEPIALGEVRALIAQHKQVS